ncbi:MAG: hypothetical protein MK135_03190 [Polyangiaceae bacterium]|nr:hypothetical protein [Polyangiaceae bacterium]
MTNQPARSINSMIPSLKMAVSREGKLRWEYMQSLGVHFDEYLRQIAELATDDLEILEQHKEFVEILASVARRLGKAHEEGVVHGRLTMEDILVDEQREAWIVNWRQGVFEGAELEALAKEDQKGFGQVLEDLLCLRAKKGVTDTIAPWAPKPLITLSEYLKGGATYSSMRVVSSDLKRYVYGEEMSGVSDTLIAALWRRAGSSPRTVLGVTLAAIVLLVCATLTLSWRNHAMEELTIQRAEDDYRRRQAVNQRAKGFESRVQSVEVEVARLSAAFKQVMRFPAPSGLKFYRPIDLKNNDKVESAHYLPRYGQTVAFDVPIIATAPKAPQLRARQDEQRLTSLNQEFIEAYQKAGHLRGSKEQVSATQWTYGATPSGVLLNYPAGGGLSVDYDPRTRPWYLDTVGKTETIWGTLYGDAGGSGTQLPCNQAVYSDDGELLGVVGIDFRLADIRVAMFIDDVPGYAGAWLVNREGEVIVEAREEASLDKDEFRSTKKKLKKFPLQEVLDKIWQSKEAGSIREAEGEWRGVYQYAAIPSLKWVYIARFQDE